MKKIIQFSGIGFESGQSKRGLIYSPQKSREYFYILKNAGIEVQDFGDIIEEEKKEARKIYSTDQLPGYCFKKHEEAYLKNSLLFENEKLLVSWGGDHSVGIPTVGAFLKNYPAGYVLWIDAHADINLPEESISGHLHGMPLAVLMNLRNIAGDNFSWIKNYLLPERLIYLGIRDLDPFEVACIEKLEITYYTMKEIRRIGIKKVVEEIKLKIKDTPLHVSFDIDSVDPEYAPSTGVPVEGGLDVLDLESIAKNIQDCNLKSMDIVELNPSIGQNLEVDQTFITGVQFLKNSLVYTGGKNEVMGNGFETEYQTHMEWAL